MNDFLVVLRAFLMLKGILTKEEAMKVVVLNQGAIEICCEPSVFGEAKAKDVKEAMEALFKVVGPPGVN